MNHYHNQISDLESELEQEFEYLDDDNYDLSELDQYSEEEFDTHNDDEMFEFEQFLEEEEDLENNFADRFFELSNREFESESDLDYEINNLMNEMEQEFFFGKLKKLGKGLIRKGRRAYNKGRKFVNTVKRNPLFKTLRTVSSPFSAFKKVSSLLPASLKPMLSNLAKTGLASFVPGGAAALPILNGLGFGLKEMEIDDPEAKREAWQNFTDVAERSYELIMDYAEGDISNPLKANEIANRAFSQALSEKGINPNSKYSTSGFSSSNKDKIITLRPGQRIAIKVSGS